MNANYYLEFSIYAALILVFMYIGNVIMNLRVQSRFHAPTSIAQGVTALGLRRGGYQLGLAIGMMGLMLTSTDNNLIKDVSETAMYGLVVLGFMFVSLLSTDKVMLPHIDNDKEVYSNNMAVGSFEFGALVMTGCVAFASIYGVNGGLLSSLGFFILGQVACVLVVLLFVKIHKEGGLRRNQKCKIDLTANIKKGEVASGIYLAGKVIAYGCIMMSAIKGNNHSEILPALAEFGEATLIGMVFLYVSEKFIDIFILTEVTVHQALVDNNVAAILQLSSAKIGAALLLGFAIL